MNKHLTLLINTLTLAISLGIFLNGVPSPAVKLAPPPVSPEGEANDSKAQIDKDGNSIVVHADGLKEITRQDGSYGREGPGWSLEQKSRDGTTTSVHHRDGTSMEFEYGPDGQLTRYTTHGGTMDGMSWRKHEDTWNLYDQASKDKGQTLEKGSKVEVDRLGNFIFEGADHHREITTPDGAVIHQRPDGKVAKVTVTPPSLFGSLDFEYGADGYVNKFTMEDGCSWRKEGDTWSYYDSNGNKRVANLWWASADPTSSSIGVDADGNFIVTYANGTRDITHTDGRVSH